MTVDKIIWTGEMEEARVKLCQFWIATADRDFITYSELIEKAIETEQALTLLGEIAGAKPEKDWRCFHCDEVFVSTNAARDHFGMDQCSDPACLIKMGAEGSLVRALRKAEQDAADAWAAIHNETTDAARAYQAQAARHGAQLTAAEELGYERGLADARKELSEETQP